MTAILAIGLLFNTNQGETKMSKFNYLKKAQVDAGLVKEYPISDLEINGKTPTLLVKTASDANRPLFKRRLLDAQNKPARKKSKKVTPNDIADIRRDDIGYYSEYVVTGWKNVIDDTGKEVPFDQESCADYLESLPTWMFDALRDFCSDPVNHTDSLEIDSTVKK